MTESRVCGCFSCQAHLKRLQGRSTETTDPHGPLCFPGEWRDGLQHGEGVEEGKEEYRGKFMQGMRHGKGTILRGGFKCYIGLFSEGRREGHSFIFWPGGNKFKGICKDDRLSFGALFLPHHNETFHGPTVYSYLENP